VLIQSREQAAEETDEVPETEAAANAKATAGTTPTDREPAGATALPAAPRVRDLRSMRWLASHGRVLLVGLLILALAGGLGYTTLKLRHQDAVSRARSSSLAAAQTYAVYMASYDYRHLDQDFGKVKQHSTASFQATFERSSSALVTLLKKFNATATANIVGAGLVSADTNRAVVIVFLTQKVTNTAQKTAPPETQSRLRITMVRQHGQWLIDKVDLL
jgi:Mce-associated membrane protein